MGPSSLPSQQRRRTGNSAPSRASSNGASRSAGVGMTGPYRSARTRAAPGLRQTAADGDEPPQRLARQALDHHPRAAAFACHVAPARTERPGPLRRPAVQAQRPVSTGLSWFNCLSTWCQRTCQGTVFAVGWVPVGPAASAPGTGARACVACARRWMTTAPKQCAAEQHGAEAHQPDRQHEYCAGDRLHPHHHHARAGLGSAATDG